MTALADAAALAARAHELLARAAALPVPPYLQRELEAASNTTFYLARLTRSAAHPGQRADWGRLIAAGAQVTPDKTLREFVEEVERG